MEIISHPRFNKLLTLELLEMYNLKTPILIFSSSFLKITLDIICQLKNSGLTLTCIGKKNFKIGTEILVHLKE